MSIRLGAGENIISGWMSSTEKAGFENLKRLIFDYVSIIEKMILKNEIDLNKNAIRIVKT